MTRVKLSKTVYVPKPLEYVYTHDIGFTFQIVYVSLYVSGVHAPTSCEELRDLSTTFSDGYYWLSAVSTQNASLVGEALYYCFNMSSCDAATYLPLPAGIDTNFAHADRKKSSRYNSCDKANHYRDYGHTEFSAVRLHPGNSHKVIKFDVVYRSIGI